MKRSGDEQRCVYFGGARNKPCYETALSAEALQCLPCWNDQEMTRLYSCPIRHYLCESHYRRHTCEEGNFMQAINAVTSGLSVVPEAISLEALNTMNGNTRNSVLTGYAFTVMIQPAEIFQRLGDFNYPVYVGDHCFSELINDLNKKPATAAQIRMAFQHSQLYFVPYSLDVVLRNVFDGALVFYCKTKLDLLMEALSKYGNGLKDHLTVLVKGFPNLMPPSAAGQQRGTAFAPALIPAKTESQMGNNNNSNININNFKAGAQQQQQQQPVVAARPTHHLNKHYKPPRPEASVQQQQSAAIATAATIAVNATAAAIGPPEPGAAETNPNV